MIGTQSRALLLDAYRDLNSRKLFWIVLVLNLVVVAGFSALGVKNNRLFLLGWEFPHQEEIFNRAGGVTQFLPMALLAYKGIFSFVIVGQWLTWAATILALISTASIFPDFMAGGSIDLYLSKPISRLRLFLTKYLTGLLFVTLQVTVFTTASFFVLGWRADTWQPGLFWAIPIVVLFFSYLFALCTLFGVLTRSTLASFFLTIVAWAVIAGLNASDRFFMQAEDIYQQRSSQAQRQVASLDRQIADLQNRLNRAAATRPGAATLPLNTPDATRLRNLTAQRDRQQQIASQQHPPDWVQTVQPVVFALNTAVPKTQETISLLDRKLFDDPTMKAVLDAGPQSGRMHGWRARAYAMLHGHSTAFILGSSIVFETLILGLAAWLFCRRDY